ncbi:MAG TPA: metal-dependent hydrolase, partial [Actinomycetota bacterium]|nr:metal-dependent hydrolase [Actinomycetota bacterium]
MVLWHAGVGALITYLSLGRRRIDYRFVLLGAVAPDAIDGLVALWLSLPALRGPAHTLLAVVAATIAIVVFLRGERRLAVFGLAVGWLTHLVADGMWAAQKTLYWPAFGKAFDTVPVEPYALDLFARPWAHLSTWGAEIVGAAILLWFWVAFRLGHENRLRVWLTDGYLR